MKANVGAVLWLTGLSGAGKSTLARALHELFEAEQVDSEWLDGDRVREVLRNTGFSQAERTLHLRYIAYTASLLERRRTIVICSFVTPLADQREFGRSLSSNYIEIHLSTPLEVCEIRDTKGLYQRARMGEIPNFTGISSEYEIPISPAISLNAAELSVEDEVQTVLEYLRGRRILSS